MHKDQKSLHIIVNSNVNPDRLLIECETCPEFS